MRIKAFVDANVLVSVLNKEFPLYNFSARVLSLASNDRYELYTTPLCLAIGFYFSAKKSGDQLAKKKIGLLSQHLSMASVNQRAVQQALSDPRVEDLEDGFQYYAALEAGCDYLITENGSDYYFSKIEVLSAEDFLTQKVLGK